MIELGALVEKEYRGSCRDRTGHWRWLLKGSPLALGAAAKIDEITVLNEDIGG
jgi:hypothetical protein